MKIMFKVFLAVVGFISINVNAKLSVSAADAMWAQNYAQAKLRNPQIDDMRFGDGTDYATTEPNMKEIAIRRIINEREDTQLPADKKDWAPCQWNYKILDLFTAGVANNSLSCNATGLDNLWQNLMVDREYNAFRDKIAAAIKDDKTHCDNVDFYNIVRKFKSDADRRNVRFINKEDRFYLQGYEPNYYPPGDNYGTCYCEPRAHMYDDVTIPVGRNDFIATIPMTEELNGAVSSSLGTASGSLSQNLGILVGFPADSNNTRQELAFKPQWALRQFYNNAWLECNVECNCAVYDFRGSPKKTIQFPREAVILHPDGSYPTASRNTHHLGFTNDDISRAVLYNVKYLDGYLRGTTKTGLIFVFSEEDYDRWYKMAKLSKPIGEIFQTMREEGRVSDEIMRLLGINALPPRS